MTLTSQLGGNTKTSTPLMKKKRKDSTASLKEDAKTKKKEKKETSSSSTSSSNTERKPVQRKPSFIRRALADLGFNKVISRSISLSSDLDRIDSIKKTLWTASLSSLKEDVSIGEDDNVILEHDFSSERGATCGVKRTQSLLLGGSKRDERLRKIQERGLQSIPRRRATSHGGPPSPGIVGHFDPPESPTLTTQTPATSLPCLLKFPVVEEHAASEPPRYRRQSSSEANRRNSKLRRQEAFKNDRGAISHGDVDNMEHFNAGNMKPWYPLVRMTLKNSLGKPTIAVNSFGATGMWLIFTGADFLAAKQEAKRQGTPPPEHNPPQVLNPWNSCIQILLSLDGLTTSYPLKQYYPLSLQKIVTNLPSLHPAPVSRKKKSTRGRKACPATLVTGSPYKAHLEASVKKTNEIQHPGTTLGRVRGDKGHGLGGKGSGWEEGQSGLGRINP